MIRSNVKEIMKYRGVTIRQMASDTRLAPMTIIRARSELIGQVKLCNLKIIADYLNCEIKDLFDDTKQPQQDLQGSTEL